MTSRLIDKPFTNSAFGFPTRGHARRIPPVILGVCHITANASTARMADPLAGAAAERSYANRAGSGGPSAHLYIGRDGRGYRALDWSRFAAWSNGDVNRPDTRNGGIAKALALRAKGYNLNEACGVEAELLGSGSALPVNSAQLDTFAEELARAAKRFGLPIDRNTVVGHYQVNSVDRSDCPAAPARHDAVLNELVTRTRAWYAKLYAPAPPVQPPAPPPPTAAEYPNVIVTDRTPTTVRVRVGASLYDLNGKAVVTVSADADRDSPAGTAAGRLVLSYFSGAVNLVLAKAADIASSSPAPDQAARLADLEKRLATIDGLTSSLASAGSSVASAAASIHTAATS